MAKLHPFMNDNTSGAGNCMCGASKHSMRHPHSFLKAHFGSLCVCGLPTWAEVHDEVDTTKVEVKVS